MLFDIDGTLLSTGGAGRRALDRAFEQLFGVCGAFASIELPGRTDPLIVRDALRVHGISDLDYDRARFRNCTSRRSPRRCSATPARQVFPAVVALLQTLGASRFLALLTGTFQTSARLKFEYFDLWRYFRCGACGDDAADRHVLVPIAVERAAGHGYPRTSARVVVIGDTPHDVACAAAAGAESIAVATGSASVERLQTAGADVVFETLADTNGVVAAIDTLIAEAVVRVAEAPGSRTQPPRRSAGSDRF